MIDLSSTGWLVTVVCSANGFRSRGSRCTADSATASTATATSAATTMTSRAANPPVFRMRNIAALLLSGPWGAPAHYPGCGE